MKIIVKVGGAALEDKDTLRKCAHAIVDLARDGHKIAVVHGGGSTLTRTLALLGKKSDFVDGLRITDAETRDVAVMVLAGMVNKGVVAALVAAGNPAIGLCGGDGMSFRARKKETKGYDLGFVGEICSSSRAGWKPSGTKAEFPCSRHWRSAPMANITTSTPIRWLRPAPSPATPTR